MAQQINFEPVIDFEPIDFEQQADAAAPKSGRKVPRAASSIITPIPRMQQGARRLADMIDITPRSTGEVPEREDIELPTNATDAMKTLLSLVAAPVTNITEAAKELPGAISSFVREPAATARGFGAGVVEGLGNLTPLDFLTLAFGRAGMKSSRARASRKAESAAAAEAAVRAERRANTPTTVTDNTQAVALGGPRSTGEARLVRSGETAAPAGGRQFDPARFDSATSPEGIVRSALEDIRQGRNPANAQDINSGFSPPGADPSMPATLSRQVEPAMRRGPSMLAGDSVVRPGPAIPDPGGAVGAAQESGRRAVQAQRRAVEARRKTEQDLNRAAQEQSRQLEREARAQRIREASAANRTGRARATDAVVASRVKNFVKESDEVAARIQAETPQVPRVGPDRAAIEAVQQQALADARRHQSYGAPPSGVAIGEWANIHAIQDHARSLIRRGVKDVRLIDNMRRFWGAEEAARRLGMSTREVADLSGYPHRRHPVKMLANEVDTRYRHLLEDPKGFMKTETLAAMAGATAGGLMAATLGDEDAEDVLAYTISGAILGGATGWLGAKGLQKVAGKGKDFYAQQVEALDTANLLAGPAVIKSSMGSLAGVSAGLWQRLREGRMNDFQAGLKFMQAEGPKLYWDILTGPSANLGPVGIYANSIARRAGRPLPPTNAIAKFVLRPFIASDRAGSAALQKMGFSADEGSRLMLIGEPTSWQGQAMLRVINSNWLFRMLAKFPRVRIGGLERGVEFTPFLSSKFADSIRKPGQHLSTKGRRARAEFGGAAMVAGGAYGYFRDPGLAESGMVASAAGPAFVPAAAAIGMGKAVRRGDSLFKVATSAAEAAAGSAPQITESSFRMLPQRFVPLRPARRLLSSVGLIEPPE